MTAIHTGLVIYMRACYVNILHISELGFFQIGKVIFNSPVNTTDLSTTLTLAKSKR